MVNVANTRYMIRSSGGNLLMFGFHQLNNCQLLKEDSVVSMLMVTHVCLFPPGNF